MHPPHPARQPCTATTPTTVYFGAVEIRNWKLAGLEQILTYPHPSIKLTHTKSGAIVTHEKSWLHRDHLGPESSRGRAITRLNPVTLAVEVVERATYKPFGPSSPNGSPPPRPPPSPRAG